MSFFILVRGPLGVGKSTISQALAKNLDAHLISIDALLEQRGLEQWEDGWISERSFILANGFAISEATEMLHRKVPVIIEGNFYWRSQVDDLVERLKFAHFVFTLKAPLDICIERDSKRVISYGRKAAIDVFQKSSEFESGVVIDATSALDVVVALILSYLAPTREPP